MCVFILNNILTIKETKITLCILLIEAVNIYIYIYIYIYIIFVTVKILKMFRIRLLLFCFVNICSLIARQIAQYFARVDYLLIKICSRNKQKQIS